MLGTKNRQPGQKQIKVPRHVVRARRADHQKKNETAARSQDSPGVPYPSRSEALGNSEPPRPHTCEGYGWGLFSRCDTRSLRNAYKLEPDFATKNRRERARRLSTRSYPQKQDRAKKRGPELRGKRLSGKTEIRKLKDRTASGRGWAQKPPLGKFGDRGNSG